ncbi:hypothetical protein R80B4_02606 [Fibrobacteres bacterium R8-0-B4]
MHWIIDRVENKIAVLINTETEEELELPKKKLPKGSREGVLLLDDGSGVLRVDLEETAAQVARLQEQLSQLRK